MCSTHINTDERSPQNVIDHNFDLDHLIVSETK